VKSDASPDAFPDAVDLPALSARLDAWDRGLASAVPYRDGQDLDKSDGPESDSAAAAAAHPASVKAEALRKLDFVDAAGIVSPPDRDEAAQLDVARAVLLRVDSDLRIHQGRVLPGEVRLEHASDGARSEHQVADRLDAAQSEFPERQNVWTGQTATVAADLLRSGRDAEPQGRRERSESDVLQAAAGGPGHERRARQLPVYQERPFRTARPEFQAHFASEARHGW
jgi:hypothetical protein